MSKKVKAKGRRAHWLSHLERARALKVPLTQYCRDRGLSVQSLYNVRHEQLMRDRGAEGKAVARKAKAKAFVAVEVVPTPPRALSAACRIQLREVVIECTHLPEVAWLIALSKGVHDVES